MGFLGLFLVILFAMLSVLCLIGAVISLLMLRPIISMILFACFVLFAIVAFGIALLWILTRI